MVKKTLLTVLVAATTAASCTHPSLYLTAGTMVLILVGFDTGNSRYIVAQRISSRTGVSYEASHKIILPLSLLLAHPVWAILVVYAIWKC